MVRRSIIAAVAAAVAGAVVLSVLAGTAGATTRTAVYATGGGDLGYVHPVVKPSTWTFGAGGGLYVNRINWSYWHRYNAFAHGKRHWNTCIPNCAAGNYITSRATLSLWRTRLHHGQRFFVRMTMRWTTPNGTHKVHIYRFTTQGGTLPVWH